MDLNEKILIYETEECSDKFIIELFSELIKTGKCWTLQGHFGRTAQRFINEGIISSTGEINYLHEFFDEDDYTQE